MRSACFEGRLICAIFYACVCNAQDPLDAQKVSQLADRILQLHRTQSDDINKKLEAQAQQLKEAADKSASEAKLLQDLGGTARRRRSYFIHQLGAQNYLTFSNNYEARAKDKQDRANLDKIALLEASESIQKTRRKFSSIEGEIQRARDAGTAHNASPINMATALSELTAIANRENICCEVTVITTDTSNKTTHGARIHFRSVLNQDNHILDRDLLSLGLSQCTERIGIGTYYVFAVRMDAATGREYESSVPIRVDLWESPTRLEVMETQRRVTP